MNTLFAEPSGEPALTGLSKIKESTGHGMHGIFAGLKLLDCLTAVEPILVEQFVDEFKALMNESAI